MHVIPLGDLIQHEATDDCPCGPATEPIPRGDGSIGWLHTHRSLDGRDAREDQPVGTLKRAVAALARYVAGGA